MTGASLAELARRVRRLPAFGRLGPEAVAEERDEIAAELQRLARTAQRRPSPVADATRVASSRPVSARPVVVHLAQERVRRVEALARSQAAEIERLRRLLAEAVRRPGRRKRATVGQPELPLP